MQVNRPKKSRILLARTGEVVNIKIPALGIIPTQDLSEFLALTIVICWFGPLFLVILASFSFAFFFANFCANFIFINLVF